MEIAKETVFYIGLSEFECHLTSCLFVAFLQVCLWLCGSQSEIGCVTTNLAKVQGKQTEQRKLE